MLSDDRQLLTSCQNICAHNKCVLGKVASSSSQRCKRRLHKLVSSPQKALSPKRSKNSMTRETHFSRSLTTNMCSSGYVSISRKRGKSTRTPLNSISLMRQCLVFSMMMITVSGKCVILTLYRIASCAWWQKKG